MSGYRDSAVESWENPVLILFESMKLEEHPFIQSIAEEHRAALFREIDIIDAAPGTFIFKERSEPDALYLILEGAVTFTKLKHDGQHQAVSESTAGSFFGEASIFTGEKRALGARAKVKSRIARVPEKSIKCLIHNSALVQEIFQNLIDHLKSTTKHYMEDVMRTEKLALVGTMVSSLLHDFKNPFAIISLGSTIIQNRYPEDAKTAKICSSMESQIRRMVDMANDLAAFARGEHEIEITEISLDTLFDEFHELNSPFFNHDRIQLRLCGNGVTLQGDAIKLLRVLQNLVGNAIDAILTAEIEGKVDVSAEEKNGEIHLKIIDNGPGIPQKIRENLFEPFVTQGKSDGTGLGTAIAKSVVDAHRGSIEFETSAHGTAFTIRLPQAQR